MIFMLRALFIFTILIALVFFPAQYWPCSSPEATQQVITSPCDDSLIYQLTTIPALSTGLSILLPLFALLIPAVAFITTHCFLLLTPEEITRRLPLPPPRYVIQVIV